MNKAIKKVLNIIAIAVSLTLIIGNAPLSARPINLMWGTFDAQKGPFSKMMMEFAKEVEKETNGKVKIKINWVMGKPGEMFEMAQRGIVDMAWDTQTLIPGIFPQSSIFELPFIIPTAEIGTKAFLEYIKMGYKDRAYSDNVKLLIVFASDAHNFIFRNKNIQRVDQLQGLKIGVGGSAQAKFVALLGGIPVGMPMTEMYTSLQKGIVDGTIFGFPMLVQFRLFEVGEYVLGPPVITGKAMGVINERSWNRIPAKHQKTIEELGIKYSIIGAKGWDGFSAFGKKLFMDNGGMMNILNQAELKKMSMKVAPVWGHWAKEMDDKGYNGKKALNDMYNILRRLGVENPAIGYKP